METIYENKDRKSAVRYNGYFDMISIKTKSGVFCIPGEVLEEIKNDKELVGTLEKLFR